MPVRPSLVSAVLVVAVLGVSLSGPLVRLADAHPVAIATWRLVFSLTIIAVPLTWSGAWRQIGRLDRRSLALAAAGGVMLALHFWTWNTSVTFTTIAASVVLVNVQPLIVGMLSVVWLKEPPTRRQWIGIGVALLGACVVVLPDLVGGASASIGGRATIGDLLAFVGAVLAACYYVIGRRLRATLDLWAYVAVVYGSCLAVLLVIAVVIDVPLIGYSREQYGIFMLLALGPMLLGHTGMNWALRYARAYQVNIVLLGEPIGATLLAAILPGIRERPTIYTIVGGALVLSGIVLAERKREG